MSWATNLLNKLKQVELFSSKGNTLIIQAFPKKNVLYVSYKGKIKTAYFHDETMRHLLKGNDHYKKHADRFLTIVGQLIQKTINE